MPIVHFQNEKELEDYIREHSTEIFCEPICFDNPPKRSTLETGYMGKSFDLTGKDKKGTLVCVEVKWLKYKSCGWTDRFHKAVGQLLHYTHCFCYPYGKSDEPSEDIKRKIKELRLFIVCEAFSPPVENICRMLRAFGFNIKHLSVNKQGDTT